MTTFYFFLNFTDMYFFIIPSICLHIFNTSVSLYSYNSLMNQKKYMSILFPKFIFVILFFLKFHWHVLFSYSLNPSWPPSCILYYMYHYLISRFQEQKKVHVYSFSKIYFNYFIFYKNPLTCTFFIFLQFVFAFIIQYVSLYS